MNDLLTQLTGTVPTKWITWLTAAYVISQGLGRIYHAIAAGGGIKGIFTALWLGTNTTPEVKAAIVNIAARVDAINQEGANPMAAPALADSTTVNKTN
jgi:hypothetical protein